MAASESETRRPAARGTARPATRDCGPRGTRAASPARLLVSLGSNIDPERHLRLAVSALDSRSRLHVSAVSRVYRSAAVGSEGPTFLNAAVRLDLAPGWRPTPMEFKYDVLRAIEGGLGRRRLAERNAPRTIDLDLSLFDDLVLDQSTGARHVELPDPEILTRPYVALPLAEVAPEWRHPTDGRTLARIAREMNSDGLHPLTGFHLQPGTS